MERLFRSLKTEWVPNVGYMSAAQAQQGIGRFSDAALQLGATASVQRWIIAGDCRGKT